GAHNCARLADGTVRCWGSNQRGEAGGAPVGAMVLAPTTAVAGIAGAVAIAARQLIYFGAQAHSCAGLGDGSLWGWGRHSYGQLGPGDAGGSMTAAPVRVAGVGPVSRVAASGTSVCAIERADAGRVLCWGNNTEGALGNPSRAGPDSMPAEVLGVRDAVQL